MARPDNDPMTASSSNDDDESSQQQPIEAFKLAPFNPSSLQIQERAMELLKLSANDVLFDLGCGDGRLLIAAAQQHPGLRCVGVDIDPVFVQRGQQAIQDIPDPQVRERLDIRLQDALSLPLTVSDRSTHNLSTIPTTELTLMDDATALYLFVLPKGINKLMPLLEALVEARQVQQRRPFRILSYMFQIHQWEPTLVDKTSKAGCPIYLYEFVPQEKEQQQQDE